MKQTLQSFLSNCSSMAEAWENCLRADWMLRMVDPEDWPSELRLYACWCAHEVGEALPIVDVAERFARGEGSWAELEAAREALQKTMGGFHIGLSHRAPSVAAILVAFHTSNTTPLEAAWHGGYFTMLRGRRSWPNRRVRRGARHFTCSTWWKWEPTRASRR